MKLCVFTKFYFSEHIDNDKCILMYLTAILVQVGSLSCKCIFFFFFII